MFFKSKIFSKKIFKLFEKFTYGIGKLCRFYEDFFGKGTALEKNIDFNFPKL